MIQDRKSQDEPPVEPIKLAVWLINRGLKEGIRLYGNNDLRKLANYLLIYCGDEMIEVYGKEIKMNVPSAETFLNASYSGKGME